MWQFQCRWASFGSHVHPIPLKNIKALFAPLAMVAILVAPIRKLSVEYPHTHEATYMDDRTAMVPNMETLHAFLNEWQTFSQLTRLQSNESKTEIVGRTPEALEMLSSAGNTPASFLHV